jgi:hypothetical protein
VQSVGYHSPSAEHVSTTTIQVALYEVFYVETATALRVKSLISPPVVNETEVDPTFLAQCLPIGKLMLNPDGRYFILATRPTTKNAN